MLSLQEEEIALANFSYSLLFKEKDRRKVFFY